MQTTLSRALTGSMGPAPFSAADPGRPHPHRGRLTPYPQPPPPIPLDEAEQAALRGGAPVLKQVEGEQGGRGAAVFVVQAPPARVWEVIEAFASYPERIAECEECEVYDAWDGRVFVRFVIAKAGVSAEYFVEHVRPPGADWMTWTLDYDRRSDLDDSVGMWRVTPFEGDPGRSRVEYSVDLKVDGWVPAFVRSFVVERGLLGATSWVKRAAEGA